MKFVIEDRFPQYRIVDQGETEEIAACQFDDKTKLSVCIQGWNFPPDPSIAQLKNKPLRITIEEIE